MRSSAGFDGAAARLRSGARGGVLVAVLGVLALTAGAGTVVVRHVRDAALDARTLEQQQRIQALEAENAALRARLDRLDLVRLFDFGPGALLPPEAVARPEPRGRR